MEFLKTYKNILSKTQCNEIIGYYQREGENAKRNTANLRGEVREWSPDKSSDFWDKTEAIVREKCDVLVSDFLSNNMLLELQSYRYGHLTLMEQKDGYNIPYHYDAEVVLLNDQEHIRNFAVLIYLNDNFENGELIFPLQKTSVKPEPGLGLVFPTSFMYPHLTNSAIGSNRYLLRVAYYFKKESVLDSVRNSKNLY